MAARKRIVPVVCWDVTDVAVPEGSASRNYVFPRNDEEKRDNLAIVFHAPDADLTHVHAHSRFLIRAREWEGSRTRR